MKLNGFLDTNILVDISCGYSPAFQWIQSSSSLFLGIPSLVRMEMVLGSTSKVEQEKVLKSIRGYPIVFPNADDAIWAMDNFERYHLSHSPEIIDCFVAAMAFRFQIPLYTRNVKHFVAFKNIRIIQPYQ
jgi:predicted nucleic acid-binding protein